MLSRSTQRVPIKHTKTFSGCWTCRSRHLKCDEERPECQRCLKAGLQCKGYEVKLVWTNSEGHARQQNIRRALHPDSAFLPLPLPVYRKVDRLLKDLDAANPGVDGEVAGPFSVFAVEKSALSAPDTESDAETDSTEEIDNSDFSDFADIEAGPSITVNQSGDRVWDFLSQHGNRSLPLQLLSRQRSDLPLLHLDLLPRPAEQRMLLHHWTNFLCWHLVPVDMNDNPFRSVLTPIAMSGLMSPSYQSGGQVALFHAICATSAHSRAQLLNGDARSQVLAMNHYQLAITHLRHSLKTPNESQRESILATIMMFSAMDMITGRSSEWRTHLQGGASWLATMDSQSWGQDRSSAVVYQSYLAIAALCNINLPGTVSIESDDWLDARFYCLDRFFGLARQTLQHIMIMNDLVKKVSKANPAELDELEQQLFQQTPEKLDLAGLDYRSEALSRHHAYVFYYASLVFFQRSVRRVSPADVQTMVVSAVEHLEAIEELGRNVIGCTLVWPPFVVACECQGEELQTRMLDWYEGKRRHGFMNLQLSSQIAQEVWMRRRRRNLQEPASEEEGEGDDIQWQDVLADLKLDIVLA